MMKKVLFGLSAILALFATSCQNELDTVVTTGDTSTVTFEIKTPELATRAYSDGETAKVLHYAIFDLETREFTATTGEYLSALQPETWPTLEGKQATVSFKLVTGNMYRVVFWAAAKNTEGVPAPYTFDPKNATVTVNYGDAALCNDEKRDAFYACKDFAVDGNTTVDVTLYRPFAQLNIGTGDYVAAANANVRPTQSKVTVKNLANKLYLFTGAAEGDVEANFGYADINKDELFPVADYKYLAMNYVLVKGNKGVVDVDFAWVDDENREYYRTVGSVPVQSNYRTNIYGNIFTSTADLNVEINPDYEVPDAKVNPVVIDAEGLQEALNAAPIGERTTISLAKDINGDVIDFQKAGRHIIIEGGNNKYNGTIKIHNGSNTNDGSITIKNVNFETETPGLNFIMPNEFGVENGVTRRYSNNVSVENCTFTATGTAENTVVGVQAKSTFGYLNIIGCTATGLHSLIQAQSCAAEVTVENNTINGKNGVAFKQVQKAVVKNNTITANAYGVRFDGNIDNYGIEVADNTIEATQPIIVRKMTGANNTIALTGTNVLTTSEDYHIVITNGSDDAEYVYPKGTYTLTGAAGFNIYPINASGDALQSAINNPALSEITLPGSVTSVGKGFEVNKDMTFNFANQELNAGSTANSTWYAIEAIGDYDVVINDANFTRAGVYAADGADVVFNSGVINHKPERSSRYIFCAQSGSTITIEDGTFTNDRPNNSYFWADNATITVKGGDFGGVASKNKVITSNGGQVIIEGGTFNFDPTAWLAAGFKAIKKGSIWKVVAENEYLPESASELQSALAEAAAGSTIFLAEGNSYGTIEVGELNGVTIEGAEGAAIRFVTNADTKIKDVTIKSAEFEFVTGAGQKNGAFVVVDAAAQIENLVIEECTIVGDGKKNSYGIFGQNSSASIVVKNCNFSALGYAIQTIAAGGYNSLTVEGCTFNNIISWAIMPQYGFNGDMTITDCTFDKCVGGLVKTGAFNGTTFTFTNNVITNSVGHDSNDSKWFEVNASSATKVISGNTKDGADWTPEGANGLK